jgi:hypothetical protein
MGDAQLLRATMMLADHNAVLQLAPGRRYSWVLEVNGHADDAWRLPFATQPA